MSKKVVRNRTNSKKIAQNKVPNLDGNMNEIFEYGKKLLQRNDLATNKKEAIKYIKSAAEKGHIEANLIYAHMLKTGDEIPVDTELAKEYFKEQ